MSALSDKIDQMSIESGEAPSTLEAAVEVILEALGIDPSTIEPNE